MSSKIGLTRAEALAGGDASILGRRVLAGVVDLALSTVPVLMMLGRSGGVDHWSHLLRSDLALGLAVGVAVVAIVMPTLTGGRTPGKLIFGLSVSLANGKNPSIRHHLIRVLASPADLMPIVVPGLTGFAVAASSDRQQRLADRLARTTVIDLNRAPSTSIEKPSEPKPERAPFSLTNGDRNDADLNNPTPTAEKDTTPSKPPGRPGEDEVMTVTSAEHAESTDMLDDNNNDHTNDHNDDQTVDNNLGEPVEPESDWEEGTVSTFSAVEIGDVEAEQIEQTDQSYDARLIDVQGSRLISGADEHASAAAPTNGYPPPSHRSIPVAASAAPEIRATDVGNEPDAATSEREGAESRERQPAGSQGHSGDDPATPTWSEEWGAWICWGGADRGWLRYDRTLEEWLAMDAVTAKA